MIRQMSLAALVICFATQASAQRAGESAVTAADDAFGTTVGNESIGLYDPYNARGFSPVQASNVRIEGLYFDHQGTLNNRIIRGSTVRAGISAQSYAFPAPTGVADFGLRLPGDTSVLSSVVTLGPWDTITVELDAQVPITPKLSFGFGAGIVRYDNDVASKNFEWNAGLLFRARPSDRIEVSGFWGQLEDCHNEQQVSVFPGSSLPPRYQRRVFFGQGWTQGDCRRMTGGLLGRFDAGDGWTWRAALFRSENILKKSYGDLLRNVDASGEGDHYIFRQPRQLALSYSGELRATKAFATGDLQHTVDVALRGRDLDRRVGGADTKYLGRAFSGVRMQRIPEETFALGPQTEAQTRQGTAGLSYAAHWPRVGAVSLGVQKTHYARDTQPPGLPPASSRAQPWLYNASANVLVTRRLAAYGSYTRGLEETGVAPMTAVNNGEAMPAATTQQVDAGLRFAVTPLLNVVAGVFQVEKPYYAINAANIFGPSGDVRHRGFEFSVAGRLLEGLTVVGGAVLLEPRVSGEALSQGLIGKVPVGPNPRAVILSVQYQPSAWNGLGVEGTVTDNAGQVASNDNRLSIKGITQLNLGVRYAFRVNATSMSARAQVYNVTNAFGWGVNTSGSLWTRNPRRLQASLAIDF